ncbi:hypothetical protein [Kibdelosporangium philippinense]
MRVPEDERGHQTIMSSWVDNSRSGGGRRRHPRLGEPIEIDNASEIQQINAIRRAVFGGTDDANR